MMTPPEPRSPDSLRYFAVAVLCVAVLLGIYFVQLNAKVDRQREQTVEYRSLQASGARGQCRVGKQD